MDTNTLWVFLQRILSQNESQEKTELILQELEDILRLQSSADMADIVKKAKESLPESQAIARGKKLILLHWR